MVGRLSKLPGMQTLTAGGPLDQQTLNRLLDELSDPRLAVDRTCQLMEDATAALLSSPDSASVLIDWLSTVDADALDEPNVVAIESLLIWVLEAARAADENRRARSGKVLPQILEYAAEAVNQGRLALGGRLVLQRSMSKVNLSIPEWLLLTSEDAEAIGLDADPTQEDLDRISAEIQSMFETMVREADGDPYAVYEAIEETGAGLPVHIRADAVRWSMLQPEAIYLSLGCFWLLNPDPEIRNVAAEVFLEHARSGVLEPAIVEQLPMIRSWLPAGAARDQLGLALNACMRAAPDPGDGQSAAAQPALKIRRVMATGPDLAAARTIIIGLSLKRRYTTVGLLMKDGFGIDDAFVVPGATLKEQNAIFKAIEQEAGGVAVSLDLVRRSIAMALGEGLEADRVPHAGLLQLVRLSGMTDLRPQLVSTRELLAGFAQTEHIASLSPRARKRLLDASELWENEHPIISNWYHDDEDLFDRLDAQADDSTRIEAEVWQWLENRREDWARRVAQMADLLVDTGHTDAERFIATALTLLDGVDLKTIPLMVEVHHRTLGHWLASWDEDDEFDGPDGLDVDIDDDDDFETLFGGEEHSDFEPEPEPEPPMPDQGGELPALLRRDGYGPSWLDGYLTAVVIAPREVAVQRWVNDVLGEVQWRLENEEFNRLLELILFRYNDLCESLDDGSMLVETLIDLPDEGTMEWCRGFHTAARRFRSSWPAKVLNKDDRAVMTRIEQAQRQPMSRSDRRLLGNWVTVRKGLDP